MPVAQVVAAGLFVTLNSHTPFAHISHPFTFLHPAGRQQPGREVGAAVQGRWTHTLQVGHTACMIAPCMLTSAPCWHACTVLAWVADGDRPGSNATGTLDGSACCWATCSQQPLDVQGAA